MLMYIVSGQFIFLPLLITFLKADYFILFPITLAATYTASFFSQPDFLKIVLFNSTGRIEETTFAGIGDFAILSIFPGRCFRKNNWLTLKLLT